MSSKPSSSSGVVNFWKKPLMTKGAKSGIGCLKNGSGVSSAVSSTTGGSSSIGSSSSAFSSSSCGSSSSGSSGGGCTSGSSSGLYSSPLSAAAFRFFSISNFRRVSAAAFFNRFCVFSRSFWSFLFCRSSSCFFLSSTCLARKAMFAASCFAARASSVQRALKSADGLPITTQATLLRPDVSHLARVAMRSSFTKLALTSITTKFRPCSGATVAITFIAMRSSKPLIPKFSSGLSLEVLAVCVFVRVKPLFSAHSTSARSLKST
mmetsp:Transcript_23344/g.67569  ORF Transcript_23344/g.67569 Transcript_23344/m.67569 type:complete len:264 (-) Transcript_23344:923-1714(-)